jgi:hypothetical protein
LIASRLDDREIERGIQMKRVAVIGFLVLSILAVSAIGASAAPEAATTGRVGPYEGTFEGTAYGSKGSRAPVTLDLTHRGNRVAGYVSLGEGLHVDGGWCGAVDVPAVAQYVEGQTTRWNPRRLVVNPTFDVGGFELSVDFESTISSDGDEITARAKVDLPWFCGRDPVLAAQATRD